MDGPISASFQRVCRDQGARPAIYALSEGTRFSFEDVDRAAQALARELGRLRLDARRPVAVLVGNHSSFFPLFLASLRCDLVVVPLDGDSPLAEATLIARAYEAQALVTTEGLVEHAPGEWVQIGGGLRLQRLALDERRIEFGNAVLLKLTSGSTDIPKAILCSEANLWHDGEQVAEAMGIDGRAVQLGAIPLSHSYGLGNLVMPLLVRGARLVLRNGFIPPSFVRDIEQHGVTVFPGVPFMFERILGAMALERLPRPLATLITAGAPIEAETVARFKERLGLKIHSFYGSSETGGITFDASDEVADPLTVGTRMPGVRVDLEEIDEAPVPGAGRVSVCSKAVAAGYARRGDVAMEGDDLRDGRFLTSDVGRFDEAGRLFLLGRVSIAINVAGRKVQPDEVERVLLAMPAVSQARVVGVPCAIRGQRLVACLVAAADITPMAVRRHCAQHLSPYKIPREILVLDAFPLTPRGKVDRRALEALARARTDAVTGDTPGTFGPP